jgi:hypothetical protein
VRDKELSPVHIDIMALFSASQRANKGRKRHKHTGLTSSIYLSDKLGGKQIGSLFITGGIKNGPVFIKSVPTNRAEHLRPILENYIPYRTPVFSDEQFKWLSWPNHRMVNHSAWSKEKRYRWAWNRWSRLVVKVQCAEGLQSSFKTAMLNYHYFTQLNGEIMLYRRSREGA